MTRHYVTTLHSNESIAREFFSDHARKNDKSGKNMHIKNEITMCLQDWPHLSTPLMREYEKKVLEDPMNNLGKFPIVSQIRRCSYIFSYEESVIYDGFDLSEERLVFSNFQRSNNGMREAQSRAYKTSNLAYDLQRVMTKLNKYIKKRQPNCSDQMADTSAQHTALHPFGLKLDTHTANHKHYLSQEKGNFWDDVKVTKILKKAVNLGLIYPQGFKPKKSRVTEMNPDITASIKNKFVANVMSRRLV